MSEPGFRTVFESKCFAANYCARGKKQISPPIVVLSNSAACSAVMKGILRLYIVAVEKSTMID